jgi:hypothetical protein
MNPRDDRRGVQQGSLPEPPLRCIECDTISQGDADGWHAYIAFIEEDGEPPEIAIYCPACANLEFGE